MPKTVSSPEQQTTATVELEALELCFVIFDGRVDISLSNHRLRKPGEEESNGSSVSVCIFFPPNCSKQQLIPCLKQLIRQVQVNDLPARTRSLPQREAGMTLMLEAFGKVATGREWIEDAMKLLELGSHSAG
jgi:hypothetical protein